MELMSATEAIERWPFEYYDDDTVGGMQRRIILDFWNLAEKMTSEQVALLSEPLAEEFAALDARMEEGLRTAFRAQMGYDLPTRP